MTDEDRLGDLAGGDRGKEEARPGSVAARLEADDAREERARPPEPPRTSNLWLVLVGLVFVIAAAFTVLRPDLLGGEPSQPASLAGLPPGSRLPDAAAPLATGGIDADANVALPGSETRRPACEVRGPGVVNFCDLRDQPLVLTFVVLRGTECEPWLETFDRASREVPGVRFVAVVSGEDRAAVEALVRRRGVRVPVAVDRDGTLVNTYRVAVCPATMAVAPGGRVLESRAGVLAPDALRELARRTMRGSG